MFMRFNLSSDTRGSRVMHLDRHALALIGHGLVVAALFLFLASAVLQLAEGAASQMAVSAVVLKRVRLQVVEQPDQLLLTSADIARGYVDSSAMEIAVTSNSPSGYLLLVQADSALVSTVEIRMSGQVFQLGPQDGDIAVAAAGNRPGTTVHRLAVRFRFTAQAKPGPHAWPLKLGVMPS